MLRTLLRFTLVFLSALPAVCDAAVVISVDVNDAVDSSGDTVPGFTAYVLSDDTLTLGGYTVDINPSFGAALDDSHNATPATTGTLTLGALYRDAIFAAGNNTANFYRTGLDAVIGGLTAGKKYTITAWSFDSSATGTRTSDWSAIGLGGPVWAVNNYTFNGSSLPTDDTGNRFTVTAYADGAGTITLRGRPAQASTTNSVFLSGFTVNELAGSAVAPVTVLAVDFNQRPNAGPASTQSGFQEFLMTGATSPAPTTSPVMRTFGAQTVTLTPVGGTMDDRNRNPNPPNNGPFTESLLLRDFIFANAPNGLDVRVQGLAPNTNYLVELWSYDPGSSALRVSDWSVNGGTLWDDYNMDGANAPVLNTDYKMTGSFASDASGELLISGRYVTSPNPSTSPAVFLNALRISTIGAASIVDFGHPILSEFMAENADGITDEDGDTSDWIEIWNTTANTLDLQGWRLTDNPLMPAKWVFPAGVSVPSQGYLRVWASGKNRTANPAALHTSFALAKSSGSYLAFSQPDGTIVTEFTSLPSQRENISYGLAGDVEPLASGFFQPPTPGAPNGTPVPGFVSDTQFDIKRGFYTTPQTVHVTCATPGAVIYYTLDGSEPTTSSTVVPPGGIPVATTTVLRVKAFAPPLAPSNTDTQTYIFNAHVQNQPANPAGWPSDWGTDSEVGGTVPANYEMDPNVTGSTLPGYGVTEAMNALPALSIVMNPADFHSTGSGIYTNPRSVGDSWERACSFEYLEPAGGGIHTNCGIRVHGNSSRRPFRMQKHSFRLAFRASYGDGRLDYRLFDDTNVRRFNRLVLHAFFTDGWGLVSWDAGRYRPHTALSFRDGFVKDTFAAMGHASPTGRHAHLFINGLYWGIYRIGERVDDSWCADHLGGMEADWDVIAPDTTTSIQLKSGTLSAWNNLFTLVNSPDLTIPANYDAVAAHVDLANFVDYYLLHIHADSEDWPHHNGYAVRNRNLPGAKWQFVPWDQEIAFDPLVLVNRHSVGAANTAGNGNAPLTFGVLYQKLRVNSEFRLLFADRVHKHLHNGGALSLAAMQARWQAQADVLDKAIVAESARWGDTADETPYGTAVTAANQTLKRETHWLPQVATVKNSHFPMLHDTANSNSTIAELRSQTPRLYPDTDPPDFAQFGGNVPVNYSLAMTAPTGGSTIYYTLDGTDPRTPYTEAVAGTTYTGPVTLTQTVTVKARARSSGGEWSALTEATFIVGTAASSANLAVTELHYNPQTSQDHEFIELMNFSGGVIDLTGVHFDGITFTFADGTLLDPGERIVVVRNQTAFVAHYGTGPRVAGQYTGALDNTGEQIAVIAANGSDIVRFTYNDKAPWPVAPDGGGRSLVLRSPSAAPGDAAGWRSSAAAGGSPGSSDGSTFTGSPGADLDLDGATALLEYALGGSDSIAHDIPPPFASIVTLDTGAGPQNFLTITVPVALGADDVALTAEFATVPGTWSQPAVFLGENIAPDGRATRRWCAPVPLSGSQFLRAKATLAP